MTTINERQKNTESGTPLAGPPPLPNVAAAAGRGRGALRRAGTFAKEHPVLLLSGAAGVAAIAGVPGAVALMLGMGIAALLGRKSGRQVRDEVMSKGRAILHRTAAGVPAPQAGPSPPAPHPGATPALK
jgi:hypothetical protein